MCMTASTSAEAGKNTGWDVDAGSAQHGAGAGALGRKLLRRLMPSSVMYVPAGRRRQAFVVGPSDCLTLKVCGEAVMCHVQVHLRTAMEACGPPHSGTTMVRTAGWASFELPSPVHPQARQRRVVVATATH